MLMDNYLNYTHQDKDNILRSIIDLIKNVETVLQVEMNDDEKDEK